MPNLGSRHNTSALLATALFLGLGLELGCALCVPGLQAQAAGLQEGPDWVDYQAQITRDWQDYRQSETRRWKRYAQALTRKWGSAMRLPEKKTYTRYFSKDNLRIHIDYEKGEIRVESLKPGLLKNDEQAQAVAAKMLKEGVLNPGDLPEKPVWKESAPAPVTGGDGGERTIKSYRLEMPPNHLSERARRYYPLVVKWATHNSLEPAFVMAVIERESAFNSRARSWVPAFGLMQIVPKYAGEEVLRRVPSEEYLYDPENNIRVGTAYLRLLNNEHFSTLEAGEKKRYLVTCSYNWGPHRIKNAISQGRLDIAQPPASLFESLLSIVPRETQGYLRGVTRSYRSFQKSLSLDTASTQTVSKEDPL